MNGFSLLHTVARFNFYFCFFIICFAYYFIGRANVNYVKEAIEVGGKTAVYEKSALAVLSMELLIWNIGMILLLCVGSIKNDGTHYFLGCTRNTFPIYD